MSEPDPELKATQDKEYLYLTSLHLGIASEVGMARTEVLSNAATDHWAARNLRLWQVILVWLLAVDLLVTMLWRL